MQRLAKEELHVDVPINLCSKARMWAKDGINGSDVVDNNFAEAFNAAILQSRYMSIISMLEYTRHYVMNIIVTKRKRTLSWKSLFGPKIMGKIALNKELSSYCHVNWNGAEGYEVAWGDDIYVVDIAGKNLMNNFIVVYSLHCLVISFGRGQIWVLYVHPLRRKCLEDRKRIEGKNKGETSCGTRLSKRGAKQRCQLCFKQGHNSRKCPTKQKPQHATPNVEHVTSPLTHSTINQPAPPSQTPNPSDQV
ncbi:hypothetical protein GQ457_09G021180 [Hibiscus cannabinus]